MIELDVFLNELDQDLDNNDVYVFIDDARSLYFRYTTLKNNCLKIFFAGRVMYVEVPFRADGYLVARNDVLPLTERGIEIYMRELMMQRHRTRLMTVMEAKMTFPRVKRHVKSRLAES